MGKLAGKVTVSTAATSGMALAAAKLFVKEEGYVFITGRRKETLQDAVATFGKNVTGVQGDVSNLRGFEPLVRDGSRPAEEGRHVVQKALPLFDTGGSIILNRSIAGSNGFLAFGVYSASKAAVRSFPTPGLGSLRRGTSEST
jgi:NADP-dependent 3-hydroxy acid dehydrogenase YdfG